MSLTRHITVRIYAMLKSWETPWANCGCLKKLQISQFLCFRALFISQWNIYGGNRHIWERINLRLYTLAGYFISYIHSTACQHNGESSSHMVASLYT